ncbi:MAG: hypothetical protein DMF71_05095 [Acidobacteria bacterium]|nr:MAG: hypothetical protein DMF71_05095 [Acidobacteriota bacterium]
MKNQIEVPRRPSELDGRFLRRDSDESGFIKAMSHELRTPLNVIIGSCQLLKRDRKRALSSTQRDTVDRMERNARTLLHSVNHLLDCVRTGRFE